MLASHPLIIPLHVPVQNAGYLRVGLRFSIRISFLSSGLSPKRPAYLVHVKAALLKTDAQAQSIEKNSPDNDEPKDNLLQKTVNPRQVHTYGQN